MINRFKLYTITRAVIACDYMSLEQQNAKALTLHLHVAFVVFWDNITGFTSVHCR